MKVSSLMYGKGKWGDFLISSSPALVHRTPFPWGRATLCEIKVGREKNATEVMTLNN